MRKNRGITLIALVITIIVMLILVAVTITMAINGGLFSYAGKAAVDTKTEIEKEKRLASVDDNLSTDDLIAYYTTNKEEDLAKLRAYFIGKNHDDVTEENPESENGWNFINTPDIPDARISLKYITGCYPHEYIKYHNRKYDVKFKNIDENDPTADIVESVEDVTGLTIIFGLDYEEEIIKFIPNENQTWYEWASDESNTDDVTMVRQDSVNLLLSLKEVIIDAHSRQQEYSTVDYAVNDTRVAYYLCYGDNFSDCPFADDEIIAGEIYRVEAQRF